MAFGTRGLNAALAGGVTNVGTHLALHESDPGTTGAGEDTDVVRLPAGWGAPAGGSVDSDEVAFVIPAGGGQRVYTHFSVRTDATGGEFVCGGALDESETFSDNGGVYNFTATLTAASAAA